MNGSATSGEPAAARVVAALRAAGLTVATAESLTGGLVCAALVDVPGASTVVRGAVVAYATELKESVLGVDGELLARTGPVDAEVARQMARGARARLGADVGLATTGVAGPGPADGHPAGTVFVAVAADALPGGAAARLLRSPGERAAVRRSAVEAVLADLAALLRPPA
ncbi:nicotinamide-nucleotide amidohydrolase family protein [Paenibacillus sp. TRM 82003]|uniref:CinA family protein n=1 Tax=Kineococcus sp. TRM81007 TaxID=2925831 RepID=UPI001F596867|nr:nicotinamide-nucleotide amidohydrolase family protein [Kineococcus sp. TRM81007]MCI2240305.1 nicotinamide-nucleotide amidohydrolase family protein [Kineococcus sp. TRM81007]MCI3927518.1 nicotinamide-nucleotide amidohydrolase family protein [Paenibacillus sp. TRM 82003]